MKKSFFIFLDFLKIFKLLVILFIIWNSSFTAKITKKNILSSSVKTSLIFSINVFFYTKTFLKKCFHNLYLHDLHCMKSVRIQSYSGQHFPAFGLNTERYGVSLHIQSKCGIMQTRIAPNRDTFYAAPQS